MKPRDRVCITKMMRKLPPFYYSKILKTCPVTSLNKGYDFKCE